MAKIERVYAAIAGQPVDYPPMTIWYHFGNQHSTAEVTARVHLEFFEHYDLDLLKVMNDYDYPNPAGLEGVATPEELWIRCSTPGTRCGGTWPRRPWSP